MEGFISIQRVKWFVPLSHGLIHFNFFLQEEQRLRLKQAKEDLEQFLLNHDKMNSSIKYWWVNEIRDTGLDKHNFLA